MSESVQQTSGDLTAVLRRLNPNVPAGSSGEVMPRTPRQSNAMRQIRAHIGADPLAKVLLTGHIGVGKSTELLHLAKEVGGERCVVECSVGGTLGSHNVNTFSLLVVVLDTLIRWWQGRLGDMPAGLVEELSDHVNDLLPDEKRPPKNNWGAFIRALRSELGRRENAPLPIENDKDLQSLYSEVVQRLALRSVEYTDTIALDPSPLALSCETLLKELAAAVGKPVLLILDDLDKVREQRARDDVFLHRAMAWRRLPCGIVSTLPLDAVFSSIGRELDQVWFDVQVLDPFPVPKPEGGSLDEPELQPYLSILRSVDAHEAFSGLQCRRLANASGGLPRVFVSACSASIAYAVERNEQHVRDYHIDLVLRDIADRWRGRLNDADYEALVDVLDSEGANVPKAIQLLRDGILIRDGAAPPEAQFRVAPWAEPLLAAYRRRSDRKLRLPLARE